MATYFGEPYPGYFLDQAMMTMGSCTDPKLHEQFDINTKWLVSHEDECDFAKLNMEVLTIIHEEKRLPTREELKKIRNDTLPPVKLTWGEITNNSEPENCWGVIDCPTITYELKYQGEYVEPENPWNGISYEDFIKNDPPESALASAKGVNKHTLNHRLI